MDYHKKSFFISLFVILLIFISLSTICFADTSLSIDFVYNNNNYSFTPYSSSNYNASTDGILVSYYTSGGFWIVGVVKDLKTYKNQGYYFYTTSQNNGAIIATNGSTTHWLTRYYSKRYNISNSTYGSAEDTGTNLAHCFGAITDLVAGDFTCYTDSSLTTVLFNDFFNSSIDIQFTSASSNLTGIAQGTDGSIEIELLNYNQDEMPDPLYLNIYKKVGNNYNIYSIPLYIYNQFPTYVTQAPLNEDLFLFVNKSKLYSMGINFQSSDEFYLFLSNDVAPKGFTTWNNDGTGILLGNTFETTTATIFDESGLVTIPTLTTEQEQNNQNQADTQKQIDAINQQTDAINQQTEVQQDTNDFIKNEDIDDDNISLPSIDTNDITEDGIGNIFTAIYNGLTSGDAKDIVLPFPFTNKTIVIPANYTEQFLTTSTFSPIYSIIQAFYWYIIARFIVKDISNKFEKIKSGNIENIENNNIKTEML